MTHRTMCERSTADNASMAFITPVVEHWLEQEIA